MATKRRGLGRNLDALLGGARGASNKSDDKAKAAEPAANNEKELQHIAIALIKPGRYQPRQAFEQDSLAELAASIKTQGVISPITVKPLTEGTHYELIAGERRWRAAQLAGLETIPAIIKDVDDKAALAVALIENIQREDLNPMEEARALRRLLDEFAMTHQEIADTLGKSRSTVSNLLRLMELHSEVKKLVEQDRLDLGHAKALLALDGGEEQVRAARQIVAKGLSVRETEQLVKRLLTPLKQTDRPSSNPVITETQRFLTEKLGAKVVIQHTQSGKGKLVVHYHSVSELDGIIRHIQ